MKTIRPFLFTLVELLVVISIIMLLVSILLPALKKTKDKTKTIACSSNLRQVGVGTMGYCSDYNNFLPFGYIAGGERSGYGDPYFGTWYCMMAPQLNMKAYAHQALGASSSDWPKRPCLYTCPSQSFTYPHWAPVSYAPPITVAFGITINSSPVTVIGSLAKVKTPSEKAWLCEAAGASTSPFINPYRIGDTGSGYEARHSAGANVLFMDFHTEWRSEISCVAPVIGSAIKSKGIFDTYDKY